MDETMTDERLRHLAAHWPTEMRAVATELLAARERERRDAEALRAADALAEAFAPGGACSHCAFVDGCEPDCPLALYRAARGAR